MPTEVTWALFRLSLSGELCRHSHVTDTAFGVFRVCVPEQGGPSSSDCCPHVLVHPFAQWVIRHAVPVFQYLYYVTFAKS